MLNISQKNISNILIHFFLPLLIGLLAIIIESALTNLFFISEMPPSFLLMVIFYWIISLKINLSYWFIFFLGLTWDFLVGSIPGLMATSLLLSIGILKIINKKFTISSYVSNFFFFTLFLVIINLTKVILFVSLFFVFPLYEKIVLQICFSLILFPLILILFNPIKVLFSEEIGGHNE